MMDLSWQTLDLLTSAIMTLVFVFLAFLLSRLFAWLMEKLFKG